MNIIYIVGARPQFIKLAPLYRTFPRYFPAGQQRILHTGQHYDRDMNEEFFREFGLPRPDRQLELRDLDRDTFIGRGTEVIGTYLKEVQPDLVLVFGDTNSTLAGALAAHLGGFRLAHIEAGLRSYLPIPEEMNRVLTDRLSNDLFLPSEQAIDNLTRENIGSSTHQIVSAGDIMFDASLQTKILSRTACSFLPGGPFVLCTIHRAANTDDAERLATIVDGLQDIARELPVVLPLHPRTAHALKRFGIALKGVQVCAPLSYRQMQSALAYCHSVVTDSGGVQKEAFFRKKACLVVRPATEWPEIVQLGAARLTEPSAIYRSWNRLLRQTPDFGASPYGQGDTADRIWQFYTDGSPI